MFVVVVNPVPASAQAGPTARIVDEPLELSIHFRPWTGLPGYDETAPVELRARQLTGIHLSHLDGPAGQADPDRALQAIVDSTDYPDILGGARIRATVDTLGPEGAFLALDDLIDRHAPNIRAFLEKRPDLADAARAHDGKLYHIPAFLETPQSRVWLVRQDWLDRLGLDPPETVEDLHKILIAFRTRDPNGNGLADEIPYFAQDGSELERLVTLWDGRSSGSDRRADFTLEQGRVKHGFTTDAFRAGIVQIADWYADGLIDPDLVLKGSSDSDGILRNDLGGVTHDWPSAAEYNRLLAGEIDGFNLRIIPPPESVNGRRVEEGVASLVSDAGWAISYSNRNPIETIKYFDFWFSPEGRRLANFGVEGVDFDMVDGAPRIRRDLLDGNQPFEHEMWQIGARLPRGVPVDSSYLRQTIGAEATASAAAYQTNGYSLQPLPAIPLTGRERLAFDRMWPGLQDMMVDRVRGWVSGSVPIDDDWQPFLASLDQMGLAEVLGILNRAYSRAHCPCVTPDAGAAPPVVPLSAPYDPRIADDPVTLSIRLHSVGQVRTYDENWPVEREAAAATGIHLKDFPIDDAIAAEDAVEAMVKDDRFADIFGGINVRDAIRYWGPRGAFLPLDDLIREHAPHISRFFRDREQLLSTARALDGKLYHIPFFPDGYTATGYFIRQDWLDKLGLPVPQNVDQLHDTLVAFRDRDPNGNGVKDEIPFFTRSALDLLTLVTLWDARSTGSPTVLDFYVEDGEVRHGAITEEYRTAMGQMAAWYAQGLMDPVLGQAQSSDRDRLLRNDLGGFTHDWFGQTSSYNDRLRDVIDGFAFVPMVPPASSSGRRIEEFGRRPPIRPDGWAISYSNPYPVETIRYFDFWFSPEGKRLANFGVEGQQYSMVDGKPMFHDSIISGDDTPTQLLRQIGAQIPRGFPQDFFFESQWLDQNALTGMKLYEEGGFSADLFLGVAMTEDERRIYNRSFGPVREYMRASAFNWISGTADVNEEWDGYLAKLDELGLGDLIEVMNTAYRRETCSCIR